MNIEQLEWTFNMITRKPETGVSACVRQRLQQDRTGGSKKTGTGRKE